MKDAAHVASVLHQVLGSLAVLGIIAVLLCLAVLSGTRRAGRRHQARQASPPLLAPPPSPRRRGGNRYRFLDYPPAPRCRACRSCGYPYDGSSCPACGAR